MMGCEHLVGAPGITRRQAAGIADYVDVVIEAGGAEAGAVAAASCCTGVAAAGGLAYSVESGSKIRYSCGNISISYLVLFR